MNPQHEPETIGERVAVIENSVETLKSGMMYMVQSLEKQNSIMNTICVNMAMLTTKLQQVLDERSRWKDPMVYISGIAVITAIAAVVMGK